MSVTTKTLVVYGADWCAPCKVLKTFLSKQNIKHSFINVDHERERTRKDGIRGVPTIHIMEGDKLVRNWVGFDNSVKKELLEVLDGK